MAKSERRSGGVAEERDRHVAEGIRCGSKSAFEELFRRYCDDLCLFAESYVSSAAIAEDLVHDVFCDVWDRRDRFHPKGTVRAYLFQAVKNGAYDHLKHRRVRRRWVEETIHEPVSRALETSHRAEYARLDAEVRRAVESLSERQQTVFRLARDHDLSYAEIALVLGISEKTVENHMGRALKQLRQSLTPILFFSLF